MTTKSSQSKMRENHVSHNTHFFTNYFIIIYIWNKR